MSRRPKYAFLTCGKCQYYPWCPIHEEETSKMDHHDCGYEKAEYNGTIRKFKKMLGADITDTDKFYIEQIADLYVKKQTLGRQARAIGFADPDMGKKLYESANRFFTQMNRWIQELNTTRASRYKTGRGKDLDEVVDMFQGITIDDTR